MNTVTQSEQNSYWQARPLTPPGSFTAGIEGPACDAAGVLYACNYERDGQIGRLNAAGEHSLFLRLPSGSIGNGMVFDRRGEMYVADYVGHKIYRVRLADKAVSVYVHEPKMHQPNDLAIMASGIIFASDPDWASETGQLWRIDKGGKATLLETNMGTTNGLEVSADERTLYLNETVQRRIWAYDLSPTGDLSNKRLLYQFDEFWLDGMRCDVTGNLYVTRYGGGKLTVLSPEGVLLREVALQGRDCTNLAFGGEDGRSCFVTVADRGWVEVFRTEVPGRSWALLQGVRSRGRYAVG